MAVASGVGNREGAEDVIRLGSRHAPGVSILAERREPPGRARLRSDCRFGPFELHGEGEHISASVPTDTTCRREDAMSILALAPRGSRLPCS